MIRDRVGVHVRDGWSFAKDRARLSELRLPQSEKFFPGALQRFLESHGRRHQDIEPPGFNLLEGADVQVHHFSQALLSQTSRDPLAARILSETVK